MSGKRSRALDIEACIALVSSPRWSEKTRQGDSCVVWTGAIRANGYPQVRLQGATVSAHRVAYSAAHGPIPERLELDHLCRVRACVNPDHLEAVTARENTLRGTSPAAISAAKTHCINGHLLGGDGKRRCRTCENARNKEIHKALREAAMSLGITQLEYRRQYGRSLVALSGGAR